jgi:hypothetical protein
MLRLLAAAVAVATLAACSSGMQTESLPTDPPRISLTPSAMARATPTPTPSPEPEPSPAPVTDPGLEAGDMAAVVTTDLVVRSAPAVRADSLIQPVTLSEPSVVYVIDGPLIADGYAWYLVDPARAHSALGDVPTAGWVAAGGPDGEAWIASHEPVCAEDLAVDAFIALAPQVALYCYAAQPLSVDGTVEDCGTIVGLGRPWSSACLLYVPGRDPSSIPDGCVDVCAPSVEIWFLGLSPPVSGDLVSVTGHFDDAAAQQCTDERGETTPLAVHRCRLAFVATDFGQP